MLRCARSIIIAVPLIVLTLVTIQFFQLSSTISQVSVETWRTTRSHSSQAFGSGLKHLGLSRHPQVGKCTVMHGKYSDGYVQALETHRDHALYHGYPIRVVDHIILQGLWTKEAAVLEMMLEALSKPQGERLKWIFWSDGDTVIMNKLIPLEAFLPPENRDDVHLLYTRDWNGLNNGVFMIRVSEWSVQFLSAIIAYRTFRPEEDLPFTEQSAMDLVLHMPQYRPGTVSVPPQWFNAYTYDSADPVVHFDHSPGQLLVHFAGVTDKSEAIKEWVKKLRSDRGKWEVPLAKTNYEHQVGEFWQNLEVQRTAGQNSAQLLQQEQGGNETSNSTAV